MTFFHLIITRINRFGLNLQRDAPVKSLRTRWRLAVLATILAAGQLMPGPLALQTPVSSPGKAEAFEQTIELNVRLSVPSDRDTRPFQLPPPTLMVPLRRPSDAAAGGSQPPAPGRSADHYFLAKKQHLFHSIIVTSARRHQVDPALIKAIIMAESGYNPRAVSRSGAKGLMQLMPTTADALGVENIFDPAHNIDGGVRYFKQLKKISATTSNSPWPPTTPVAARSKSTAASRPSGPPGLISAKC